MWISLDFIKISGWDSPRVLPRMNLPRREVVSCAKMGDGALGWLNERYQIFIVWMYIYIYIKTIHVYKDTLKHDIFSYARTHMYIMIKTRSFLEHTVV